MSRAFDHLVLAVDDLDAAADYYERLGFTLTPRAQHPFGTGNRLAQFQGCFLELLAVTQPDDIPAEQPGHFNFGSYTRDHLARRQGMSMMVMQTTDAAADRDDFRAAGLETYELFEFSRLAKLPDGEEVTVGFTLAVTSVPEFPEAVAFTCQQWRPDLFWKPEYQTHANGAHTITEVYLVADDGAAADRFLAGLELDPVAGKVTVMSEAEFAQAFRGVSVDGGHFGGYRVAVADLEGARACLEENRIAYEEDAERIWIAPADGFGCVIAFSATGES